jgi:hypothetical protein
MQVLRRLVEELRNRGPRLKCVLRELEGSRYKGMLPEPLDQILPGKKQQQEELLGWVKALCFVLDQLQYIAGEHGLQMLRKQMVLKKVGFIHGLLLYPARYRYL